MRFLLRLVGAIIVIFVILPIKALNKGVVEHEWADFIFFFTAYAIFFLLVYGIYC